MHRRAHRWPFVTAARGALVLLLAPCAPVLPAQDPPYQARWTDVAVIGGGVGVAALPSLLDLPKGPPPCTPCDPASLPGIDRWVVGARSDDANLASDVLQFGIAAAAGLWSTLETSSERARGNLVVLGKSIAFTEVAVQWLKVATHRSRPVLYTEEAPDVADDRKNRKSFPSGHTAVTFAMATSYAVLAHGQELSHATRNSVVLFSSAAVVGVLRVVAGKHFPTDVLAGAGVGVTIGWLAAVAQPTVP